MPDHRRSSLFAGGGVLLALSLVFVGCGSAGDGTTSSTTTSPGVGGGGHGGEAAADGGGGTGGVTSSEGGSGGSGGQGGHGDVSASALAQRLAGDVWHFETLDFGDDAGWLRFALTGDTTGTVDELPEGPDFFYFPCAGTGQLTVVDGASFTVAHACGSEMSFPIVGDLPPEDLPAGAVDGIELFVMQVTPMRAYKLPASSCDEAMTACAAN